jgi:uncharacterized membrane protein YphA (DoxX/SURF4 family)
MDLTLWILQILLAALYLMAGQAKIRRSKAELQTRMPWAEDFNQTQLRLIGTAEVLAAAGLILPGLLNMYTVLTPLAASGLAIIMAGATYTHLRRKEPPFTIVMMLLAAFVAYGRFVLLPH